MTDTDLLTKINVFLAATEMGEAYFGKLACNNTAIVKRLRAGKTVTLVTAERVRNFIASRSEAV